jgi:O-antigen ligase
LDKAAFTLYLVVLVLSPLLFGAVHTYAYTIMSLGVFTGGLLLLKKNIRKEIRSGVYRCYFLKNSLHLTFFILLIFLFFQVVPLPDALLRFLSPEAMVVGKKSLSASSTIISEGPIRHWFSLSPYNYPVRMSIIRWTVYGLFYLGLTQILNSRKRIEKAILLILIIGCFEALYGFLETYSEAGNILWMKKRDGLQDVNGTYINRNHFAGLMEICLLLAAAYAAALSDRKKKGEIIPGPNASLRVRFSRYLSREQKFSKRAFIIFAGAVMGIGLVFSASRGGLISAAGAMLCMSLLFIFRKNHRRKGFVILFLFLITSAYALYIGIEYPAGRFKTLDISIKSRARLAQTTMDLFDDYKLTGVGVGNFQYAYPRYQAVERMNQFVRHAHNDWVQFLSEAGITGFLLLLFGISYHVYRTIRLWRKRTDPFAICLGIAPLAVMTAMMIHSVSDFNLHIPANGLMLVAVMAIGHSALHLERHHGRDKTLYSHHILPFKYKGFFALLLILGLILWSGVWTVRHFVAEVYCNTVTNSTLNRDQNPTLEEIDKAIDRDRWNAAYWHKRASELIGIRNAAIGNPEGDDEDRRKRQMDIIKSLEEAVLLNPFKAEYHVRLGWEYAYLWKDPDFHRRWLPAADVSMERGAYFAGESNPYQHVSLGNYMVYRSKTMNGATEEWETAWAKARWHYRKAQSLDGSKRLADRIMRYVWRYYPDKAFVRKTLLIENHFLLEQMK